jgi:uncharacterized phage protein gp47/JayE
MTFEFLLERALNRVPDTEDKREGSVIYDAIASNCAELAQVYIELDRAKKETSARYASTVENLKLRTEERGILPYEATHAILQMETTPLDVEVAIGERFSLEKMNYVVTEKMEDGVYKVQCETVGTEGNKLFGQCVPINYVEGLETCIITELLIPAEDMEDVESLRERYFNSFNSQAFGGNRADYKEKIKSLDGVGGVKLYRTPNGGGTVGATIISSEFGIPSEELIEAVQSAIDPEVNQGEGLGLAPFGHTVTISGVTGTTVDVSTTLTYMEGWNWSEVETYVHNAIDKYFLDIAEEWEDAETIAVRISQLESRILAVNGIIDISGTTLNGVAENVVLSTDTIPTRGVVNAL